jgi:hypothetical protein
MTHHNSPFELVKPPRQGGISVGVALIGAFVLFIAAIAGIVGVWYYMHSERMHYDRQAEQVAKQKAQAELAVAKAHQEQALSEIRVATNVLERLLHEVTQLQNAATELKTNAAGQMVALHPSLVAFAQHFYETDLADLTAVDRIIARIEGARRIQMQLLSANGTAYEPTVDILATSKESASWGDERLQKTTQSRRKFDTLVQESKIKFTTATVTDASPTLEKAIANLDEKETKATEQTLVDQTAAAKIQAAKTQAEAQSQAILVDAQRKADALLAKATEQANSQARELAVRQAQDRIENSKTAVAVQSAQEEATKVELRKKASDPSVLARLAPFLTPGHLQMNSYSPTAVPFSYSDMIAAQVLSPDMNGYAQLVKLAARHDRERPRWKMNYTLFQRHPDEMARVEEVQRLLIELGPVLVEMEKLRP